VFLAELIKLKRSSLWIIAVLLPVLAVTTGTLNYTENLNDGWTSFTSQVVLFYGMLFFSVGIGLIAATAWRMEHRGTNWHMLLTTTQRPARLVLAKVGAIVVPVVVMQVVLVAGTYTSGMFVINMDGPVPWRFAVVGGLSIIAALPLVVVQSLLAMLMKSFAAPIAVCLLGCVIGVATVTSVTLRPLSYLLPQAIVTRSLNLGSSALAGSGGLTVADALPLMLTAVGLAATFFTVTVVAIRAVKLR
jgi:hypothetical protein